MAGWREETPSLMRVLQIAHYYPPETHGGTQQYVAELARLLRERGDEVEVIAGCRGHADEGAVETATEDGIVVHRVVRNQQTELLSGHFAGDHAERVGAVVEELARRFGPDVVHVHHWLALSTDLVRRLKSAGLRVVLSLHDLFASCPRAFRMPDARSFCANDVTFAGCAQCTTGDLPHLSLGDLERKLAQRYDEFQDELHAADAVLTVSGPQRDFLLSLPGFRFRDLRVERIGILAEDRAAAPEPLPGKLRVACWAGLDPRKGVHLVLEAVARTADPEAFAVHLHGRDGDPAYMEELRSKSAGLDVTFHGSFTDEERLGFASRYDVAVFPFLAFETYALAVDEALRTGIPVIVSDHGAPPERVGACGVVVARDDALALARALDDLLAHPHKLQAMRQGEHGARDLREHAWRVFDLYGEVAAGR